MKLIVAIVQDEDAGRLVSALMDKGFGVTKLATTGGFLRAGNTTLISGVEDDKLQDALDVIEKICKSREQITASKSVVSRADEILRNLELVYGNNEIVPSRSLKSRGKKPSPSVREAAEAGAPQNMQLSMFQLDDPVLVQIRDQIKGLDIDSLTPIEALNKLNEIKKITGI